MPTNPNNKSANQRFTAWLNQGLKRQNWSARRVAQMGLLIALGVVVAALYLVQSSQIVDEHAAGAASCAKNWPNCSRPTPIWR